MYTKNFTFYKLEEKEPREYANILVETTDGDYMVVYLYDNNFNYINGQPFRDEVYSWAEV